MTARSCGSSPVCHPIAIIRWRGQLHPRVHMLSMTLANSSPVVPWLRHKKPRKNCILHKLASTRMSVPDSQWCSVYSLYAHAPHMRTHTTRPIHQCTPQPHPKMLQHLHMHAHKCPHTRTHAQAHTFMRARTLADALAFSHARARHRRRKRMCAYSHVYSYT